MSLKTATQSNGSEIEVFDPEGHERVKEVLSRTAEGIHEAIPTDPSAMHLKGLAEYMVLSKENPYFCWWLMKFINDMGQQSMDSCVQAVGISLLDEQATIRRAAFYSGESSAFTRLAQRLDPKTVQVEYNDLLAQFHRNSP